MADDVRSMSAELVRDPTSLVFLRLGEALRAEGQVDAARKVALTGLERNPNLADAHDLYARILVDASELDYAQRVWESVLQIDPRHQGAHKGLGFLHYSRGDLDTALDHLELAVAADPTNQNVVQALQAVGRAAVVRLHVGDEFRAARLQAELEGGGGPRAGAGQHQQTRLVRGALSEPGRAAVVAWTYIVGQTYSMGLAYIVGQAYVMGLAYIVGQTSFQGRASSYAAEARRTTSSRKRGPTICRPQGSPLSVSPARTLAAGWPVKLNG